ncbi:hypothetical protein SAMN05216404_104212 [Nitrosospira multiformis]|uniref:Uncharacterized protein n=1 Tax=Nitrosospira multiformis TaxID=1231 RepID=A0A1H8GJW8_9PROT|nr:hypothetical protein SAMN05216404_104212 [Nitrosospira multiformis]
MEMKSNLELPANMAFGNPYARTVNVGESEIIRYSYRELQITLSSLCARGAGGGESDNATKSALYAILCSAPREILKAETEQP